jgi:hypothetical protein
MLKPISNSVISMGIAASMSMFLFACGEEEVPPPPPKQEKLDPAGEKKSSKFKKMGSEKQAVKENSKSKKSRKVVDLANSDVVKPSHQGTYVLQVGISPSKNQAKKLRDQLKAKGFKHTYLSKVINPGELDGSFFRVRLGYFKTFTEARVFGSKVLKPMEISFWIDNKSNDKVGNPENSSQKANAYRNQDDHSGQGLNNSKEPAKTTSQDTKTTPTALKASSSSPKPGLAAKAATTTISKTVAKTKTAKILDKPAVSATPPKKSVSKTKAPAQVQTPVPVKKLTDKAAVVKTKASPSAQASAQVSAQVEEDWDMPASSVSKQQESPKPVNDWDDDGWN